MTRDRSFHAEHFYSSQNLGNPNDLGDIYEKLLSDPYFLFLVTAAMFFDESNIPKTKLCKIPQETFIPSLVSIGQIVSEEKNFVELLTRTTNDDRRQVMAIANMAFGQVS